MSKTHLPDLEGNDLDRALRRSLCGRTCCVFDDQPTCKDCQRRNAKRPGLRSVGWVEALQSVAHLLAGPPIEPYPDLEPGVWHRMRCRTGSRCSCPFCLADTLNARALATWHAEQQARPHQKHQYEFGSVNAALEALLRWRLDGASARSSQGGIQSRAEETAKLGTQVQTTSRFDRDSIEIRRATWAADVEKACYRAFAEEQERRGLTQHQCVAITLSSIDSKVTPAEWSERTGLTTRAVKALIRHGRELVTIELAAVGYIPRPRSRAGLDAKITRRAMEVA